MVSESQTDWESGAVNDGMLKRLFSDDAFHPAPPRTREQTGLQSSLIESLVCKHLAVGGSLSGRELSRRVCLPFCVVDELCQELRTRQLIVHRGSAPVNDYFYSLTDQGRDRTEAYSASSAYTGPAPVPLNDYILSVEAQSIRAEAPQRGALEQAFSDISVDAQLFESLGPAINSGRGLFLFGSPGNGKTTLAQRITKCFGQEIWIPHAVVEDNQMIKVYDRAYHNAVQHDEMDLLAAVEHDTRWVRIQRPTVIVGGELTLDNLELRHDPISRVTEAPLQMKSNCGCFLIDDFGRQRIAPADLLNRWIVPLENRIDYLTLATGKTIQVPFEQLIIFSTNLDPNDLVDDAFLRRIPYKIEITDAAEPEFVELFRLYANRFECRFELDSVKHLIDMHYRAQRRPFRRCHARDLLAQVRDYCSYHGIPMEMRPEYFDRVVGNYFAGRSQTPIEQTPIEPAPIEPAPAGSASNVAALMTEQLPAHT